jgi:hypothetical protein
MERVRILGVDPSLRNTGMAIVTYNTELPPSDPAAFSTSHCQVLVNPAKYTGTEAILNMLDMLNEESKKECYVNVDTVLVESPPVMFNKAWSGGAISSIAHIAGGAVALLGIEKTHLFRPTEWNKARKKQVTHIQTITFLGNFDDWHYERRVKSEKYMEHILDAASMALWWIKSNYIEE